MLRNTSSTTCSPGGRSNSKQQQQQPQIKEVINGKGDWSKTTTLKIPLLPRCRSIKNGKSFLFLCFLCIIVTVLLQIRYVYKNSDTNYLSISNNGNYNNASKGSNRAIIKNDSNNNDDNNINDHAHEDIDRRSSSANDSTNDKDDNSMPDWITNYIQWHNKIRKLYPEEELLTNPNAPGVIIRVCLQTQNGGCRGLHDRLGQIHFDLYIANQTNRIYLIYWNKPTRLEHFLVPNRMNWTVPVVDHENRLFMIQENNSTIPNYLATHNNNGENDDNVNYYYFYNHNSDSNNQQTNKNETKKIKIRHFFEDFSNFSDSVDKGPRENFWMNQFDYAIERARQTSLNTRASIETSNTLILRENNGNNDDFNNNNHKILYHSLHAHGDFIQLNKRLQLLGETDYITFTSTFSKLFQSLFLPHPIIENYLDTIYNRLQIQPKQYSLVHCRIRHPWGQLTMEQKDESLNADHQQQHIDDIGNTDNIDIYGYPWHNNQYKIQAIKIAINAIRCGRKLSEESQTYPIASNTNPVNNSHIITGREQLKTSSNGGITARTAGKIKEQEPIVFISDSKDLVQYMVRELKEQRLEASSFLNQIETSLSDNKNRPFLNNSKIDDMLREQEAIASQLVHEINLQSANDVIATATKMQTATGTHNERDNILDNLHLDAMPKVKWLNNQHINKYAGDVPGEEERTDEIIDSSYTATTASIDSYYYPTFIDFYLGVNARCVSYGIGLFGFFAVQVSGTKCKSLHREEAHLPTEWGKSDWFNTTLCEIADKEVMPQPQQRDIRNNMKQKRRQRKRKKTRKVNDGGRR